jgi:F-type H+-transporting ATPase subunit delta
MLSIVATRYARALVDVVTEPGSSIEPALALEQLRSVLKLIQESQVLQVALESPAVAPSRKRAVMLRLLGPAGIHEKVRNFVYVVIDHRRVHEFASIVEAFEQLLDERLGLVAVEIQSARALSDPQRTALEAQVSRLCGKKAKLKFSIEPALIAGVVARVGSTVYDGSVRGQLQRMRTRLGAA